jgi:hypothetical protein
MAEERPRDAKEAMSNVLKKAQERVTNENPTEPITEAEPISDEVVEQAETDVPATEESSVETEPVDKEVVTEEPVEPTGPIDLDSIDPDPTDTPPIVDNAPNDVFADLSKAVGIEAKSQEDIINAFTQLREERDALKENPSQDDSNIPDPLKKAIELAKDGQDYREYLGIASIDYNQLDAGELYTQYIASQNPDASQDDIRDYIESMPSMEFKLKAGEYKQGLVNNHEQRKAQIEAQAAQSRRDNLQKLESNLKDFNEVAGFKVKESDKKQIYDMIANNEIANALFYDRDGNVDYKAVGELAFFKQHKDKITKFIRQDERNATKRQMLDSITNKSVERNPTAEKVKTHDDENRVASKLLKSQRERGRLL